MCAEFVRRLLNTALDNLSEVDIAESAISLALDATKRPLLGGSCHQLVAVNHHNFLELVDCDVVDRLQVGQDRSKDILHPLIVSGAQRGVPVVQHCELNGHDVAATTLDTSTALLDLLAQVQRPF